MPGLMPCADQCREELVYNHRNTAIIALVPYLQAYYDAIYNNSEVYEQFHKDINKCETAIVTPWEDGKRTVIFGLALSIPSVVKKIVGKQRAQPERAARYFTSCSQRALR